MTTREETMAFGLSLPNTYPDAPFGDENWTLVRRSDNRRAFLWVYERLGCLRMNVKVEPEIGVLWRGAYDAVELAYHMNKEHWITVRLDGSLPEGFPQMLIETSYTLTGPKKKKAPKETGMLPAASPTKRCKSPSAAHVADALQKDLHNKITQ